MIHLLFLKLYVSMSFLNFLEFFAIQIIYSTGLFNYQRCTATVILQSIKSTSTKINSDQN